MARNCLRDYTPVVQHFERGDTHGKQRRLSNAGLTQDVLRSVKAEGGKFVSKPLINLLSDFGSGRELCAQIGSHSNRL